jgi:hypothetical protein
MPRLSYLDANGTPYPGALASFYLSGTSTPVIVYHDSDLTIEHSNPVVAENDGYFPAIYTSATTALKVVMTDRDGGNPQETDPASPLILSSAEVAGSLDSLKITDAEIAALVTPVNSAYPPLHPFRYGVAGNGLTDDTNALNNWVAVLNQAGSAIIDLPFATYLCGPLNTVTASGIEIRGNGSTFKVKANSWSLVGDGSTHLLFTGDRVKIAGLTVDGNQSAFIAEPVGRLMQFADTASDIVMTDVVLTRSPAVGLRDYSTGTRFTRCHFDDNAGLGSEHIASSYETFIGCTWNRNGYGYQLTLSTSGFIAFGMAIRYRSHHITIIAGEAQENGRDGLNVNQGSYAIKYIGCLCWQNNDGGFTLAADDSGTGVSGEAETCYDIEYIDCEAYDNYASGIASYDPSHNVTVKGGRYYNNGRALGVLAFASSFPNGIYFSAGSTSINVDAKCYDDRQLRPITAASGTSPRVITATGWTSGLSTSYPRVALYNANNVFQGYGTITTDSAGSVSITTTANNGVTLASIVSGWQISQRVQHNGVFFDNNVNGVIKVDGFGFLPGPVDYTGFKAISGYLASGQNVLVPDCPLDYTELLLNPTFDADVTNWTFSTPGGGSSSRHTGANRKSPASLVLVGGSSAASGDSTLITDGLKYALGAFVELSMWVKADAAADGSITLFWTDGSTFSSGVNHPGGGWKLLKVGGFISSTATDLLARASAAIGKTVYFDNATLRARVPHIDNNDSAPSSRYLAQ